MVLWSVCARESSRSPLAPGPANLLRPQKRIRGARMSWPSRDIIGLSQKARTFAAVFLNEKRLAFQPFVRKRSTLTRLKLSVKFCCAGDYLHESSMCFLTKLFHSRRLFPREEFQIDEFLTFHGKQHRHKASPSLSAPQVTKAPGNARRRPRVPGAV